MRSILKIVSTPANWVAKRAAKAVVNGWLLRFPGGDPQSSVACVYCPEMCRFSCPTAVASGNDAVTPSNKMSLLDLDKRWPAPSGSSGGAMQAIATAGELWPLYDCTGCGRCTEYCVYDMPVAERLFEARARYGWKHAQQVARELTDAQDPWGDLAEECGDLESARRRASASVVRGFAGWTEPKAVEWLSRAQPAHALDSAWDRDWSTDSVARLRGKKWLLHESPWHSRRLNKVDQVNEWVARLRAEGIEIRRAFAQGKDCIDCGGEGAYPLLFAEQSQTMARDWWERDRARADGILCVSSRCAEHFKKVLGPSVAVERIEDLCRR